MNPMDVLTDRQRRLLDCMHRLDCAGKSAMLAYYLDRHGDGEYHEGHMMLYLHEAVAVLGYRLERVQREEQDGEGQ